MKGLLAVLTGVGALIGMYLVIVNGDKSVRIIETISKNSTEGIKALQGR